MCVMASNQSEGDASADSAIIVNIEPTQLTIVEKLKSRINWPIMPAYAPMLEGTYYA